MVHGFSDVQLEANDEDIYVRSVEPSRWLHFGNPKR